ncbi:MAG TPA: enoyl-CoA hydratase/isomerase family protein [Alphaproteobacteria bacterium]|nr:enoyl-CoA hydratase/isomerase family protein [Alphaproteobacteria bacterium]
MSTIDPTLSENVIASVSGAIGILTLDRPKALNALNQPMCAAIDQALAVWASDPGIAAVVIRSAGDRAFCAGGDVRASYEDGLRWKRGEGDGAVGRELFRTEYRMDRRLKTFPKPYIALIDGITMGGGVGISIHGSHRVATERTLWAMPETGIGFFPDVGTTFALPRLAGEVGTYLGLTGARLKAGDLAALGIATHVVAADTVAACLDDLIASVGPTDTFAAIERTLARYAGTATMPAEIMPNRAVIDRCFAHDRVEQIVAALAERDDPFAAETAGVLAKLSPTSLKLTLKALRKGATLSFDACMVMEYRMSQTVLTGHDFYEGIRAQLVDKDRSPKWYPATLDAVDDSAVDALFLPPLDGDLTFPN